MQKILFVFLLFFSFFSYSQNQKPYGTFSSSKTKKTEKKLLKSARKEFDYGNYNLASKKYLELLKIDSTNPMYNFEQAQTLYNNFLQIASIPYYENAIKYSKDSLGEAYYFLASACHLAGKFENAKSNYKRYLNMLSYHGSYLMDAEENELNNSILHYIEMCNNGIELYKLPLVEKFNINGSERFFKIAPVGNSINSEYDDYGSVLTSNDSVMYFTARLENTTGGKVDWDDKYFEDIYKTSLTRNGWDSAISIGAPINTKKHEAVISISKDSKTIYFYRGIKQGTFYHSNFSEGIWSKPTVMYEKSDLNTKAWETSFFGFAVAGNELYVVSDREGGVGGRDIYVAKKQADGSWSSLVNLGAPINTPYDEDAPFITADGMTMYFSSKGHNSMGGFDIFKSQKDADKWSSPINLGRPFNTPGEDIYFILANNGNKAYYSSSALAVDGSNDMDIYSVDFCDDVSEILLAGTTIGIKSGTITVFDKQKGKKLGDYKIENGKYAFKLTHGNNYNFTFNIRSGTPPVSLDVAIPRLCEVYDLYQELDVNQTPNSLIVRNAFFDINKILGNLNDNNYPEYLTKIDKASIPLYSEHILPIAVIVAKSDSVIAITTATVAVVATPTVAATPTVIASSQTVTNTNVDENPKPVVAFSVSNILFDYDKSSINPTFSSELDKVVSFLKNSKNAKINIAGYTDSKGSDEYNLSLSKRRANAIASYLASKGVNRNRIITNGFGETKPIAPNENPDGSDNPDGRAKNRRTEISLIQ